MTAEEADAWKRGYLIAVSVMLHQHDCPVIAEDALRDSGITFAECKRLDLDDFDMKVLRPIYANMARKDRYAKARSQAA